MGKIKIMAKYCLMGRGSTIFFMFFLITVFLFFGGNFSFIASSLMRKFGVSFYSFTAQAVVSVTLSAIGMILLLLIVSPLRLGCERWFLLSTKSEKVHLGELFYYYSFSGISKSIGAVCYCIFRKSAALLLFIFPSACLAGVLYFSFSEGEISLYISYALFGATILLFATGLVFYFVYTARYFAYYSIIVSNEKIRPYRSFDKSREITEGAYAKICRFRLSFFPWFLLCLLILPTFYVWGYYKEAKVMLSIKNEYLHS